MFAKYQKLVGCGSRFSPFFLALCFILVGFIPSPSGGSEPATVESVTKPDSTPLTSIPLDRLLAAAADFESRQQWQQAVELYERAEQFYPQTTEVAGRRQRAAAYFHLQRRYHDPSFRQGLLSLSPSAAWRLFQEIVQRLEHSYYSNVPWHKLSEFSYQHLLFAIHQDDFVRANLAQTDAAKRASLMRWLELGPRSAATTAAGFTNECQRITEFFQRSGCPATTPLILEFLCSAIEGLDPYSAHLTSNRLNDLYAMIDGAFVGLGVEVRGTAEGLLVVDVLPESPAERCGLRIGETICGIDDRQLAGMATEDAANLLQGPENSQVRLHLQSAAEPTRTLTATRQAVVVRSVSTGRILDTSTMVAYVRLRSFQKNSEQEMAAEIQRLAQQGMKGLILDLRGNPGGLLEVAIRIADQFLSDGIILSTQGRAWGQNWIHRAIAADTWDFPLAILIDSSSASSSEILAGALQDHRRAVIVGTRSYGKGSIQSIFPLRSARTGLRLTTARFYSPNGRAYEQQGVTPDYIVPRPCRNDLGDEVPVAREPVLGDDAQLHRAYEVLCQLHPTLAQR